MNNRNGKLPAVTVHYAQTLDGRIGTRTGDSQWVSSPASLELAHRLRASHDAIMVGVGTVIVDDPRLTVRLAGGVSPRRVILDSTLRLPMGCKVLTDGEAPTLIVTTAKAPEDRVRGVRAMGANVVVIGQDPAGRVDLGELLHRLPRLGIRSVLIEGGQGVITSALTHRLVHRLVVCIAPKIIGAGVEAVGDLQISALADAVTFVKTSFTLLGGDMIFDGELDPAYRMQPR